MGSDEGAAAGKDSDEGAAAGMDSDEEAMSGIATGEGLRRASEPVRGQNIRLCHPILRITFEEESVSIDRGWTGDHGYDDGRVFVFGDSMGVEVVCEARDDGFMAPGIHFDDPATAETVAALLLEAARAARDERNYNSQFADERRDGSG